MGKAKNRKNPSVAAAFARKWALGLPFISGETELTPTAGEQLFDHSLIELVRESSDLGGVVLLHCAGERTSTARQIDHAGRNCRSIAHDQMCECAAAKTRPRFDDARM